MKTIFLGAHGIRAGWRLAIFILLLFGFSKLFFWLITSLLHYQEPDGWTAKGLVVESAISCAAAIFSAALMSRIERRPFREYGLPLKAGFGKQFCSGLAWGFVCSAGMLILLRDFGAVSVDGLALHGKELISSAVLWGMAFLLLSFAEEFAFRGYAQVTLAQGMGFWPAAVLLSAFFGAIHFLAKPMENWIDAASVGLFGLFWCFTLRRTGSLWFATGFHAMLDYGNLVIFAQPNSGNQGRRLGGHLLDVTYHGPDWLTGGPLGTEASTLEFAVLAALFATFAWLYPNGNGSHRIQPT